ncbi:hypothetical protein BVY03_05955, partial [bacterium K02(2017)]
MGKYILLSGLVVTFLFAVTVDARKQKRKNSEQEVILNNQELKIAVENHSRSLATISNQVNEIVGQFQNVSGETGKNFKKNRDQDAMLKDMETRLQVMEDQTSILTGQIQELVTEGLIQKETSK